MTKSLRYTLLAVFALSAICISSCTGDSDLEENLKAGRKFLTENASKEGVIVTDTGLQYIVLKEGDGDIPSDSDEIKCYYKGTLIDGTVFDATKDGSPKTMLIAGLIPGFREALLLMPVGSKWKLFLPEYLAYGPYKVGDIIPAFSALIFEVELLEIL